MDSVIKAALAEVWAILMLLFLEKKWYKNNRRHVIRGGRFATRFVLDETGNHQDVAYVGFDVVRQVFLAEADHRHTATIDQKLLKIPANVVRLQVVVRQAIFLGEIYGRRWTVSLHVCTYAGRLSSRSFLIRQP